MRQQRARYGDIFVERCSPDTCDGSHISIKIGEEGKRALAMHVTDAAVARELAAILCAVSAEAEGAAGRSVLQ